MTGFTQAQLRLALQELDPDLRQAVLLRDAESLPYPDVARICACTVQAARARVNEARLRLACALAHHPAVSRHCA